MAGNLTETLKLRLDAETMRELEQRATDADRPPSWLARSLIREGLARLLEGERRASRVR